MRSSGCTIQQALTPEAATVVKQAVSLARRRGHAQVTPLHVANAMLSASSSASLLRQACLQSHTHPLQCRALELCFNVALNRLQTSTSSSPMLSGAHHHHPHPSISNALIAAFKRAQAHQRRGSIESQQHQHQHQQQQQQILAVKIEVEQLIISILDDPSVSRVMREAGFSSTLVKSKVEQAISVEITHHNKNSNDDDICRDINKEPCSSKDVSDDVSSIIEGLLLSGKRRKCCVVVGESLETLESAIKGAIDRIKRGDHTIDELTDVRFESLSLDSFGALSKDEIDQRIAQITRLVNCYGTKGLVLYLGDLQWATEFRRAGVGGELKQRRSDTYCPVEHTMTELRRLVLECSNESARLWLVGSATFHTYTRFRSGNPSLEAIWGFHAITIPSGNLGLSLIPQSDSLASKKTNGTMSWLLTKTRSQEDHDKVNLDNNKCNSEPTTPSLPSWLQKYKDEKRGLNDSTQQGSVADKDLCKSWSFSEGTLSFSSASPPQQSCNQGFEVEPRCFWIGNDKNTSNGVAFQTALSMYVPSSVSKANSTPNSTSSSDAMEMESTRKRFSEYNAWNLESLSNTLEKKVPWQRGIIRDVAITVLSCRSRNVIRKEDDDQNRIAHFKEDTWLFFLGDDVDGKQKTARELARVIFGSENKYISIGLSSFSSSREDSGNKRLRDEPTFTFTDRLIKAISTDPHRVFFVEDIDQMDYVSQVGLKRAIERGKMRSGYNGEEVSLEDAIIILSCERFRSRSRSRACSPSPSTIGCCSNESNANSSLSLDLNISISDACSFGEQGHRDQSNVDELGLLSCVDRCIVFKL